MATMARISEPLGWWIFCTVLFHSLLFNLSCVSIEVKECRIQKERAFIIGLLKAIDEAVMIPLHGPHPLRNTSRNGEDVEPMILGRTTSGE